MTEFRKQLEILINKNSRENESDTPDYILADYLIACLNAFDEATKRRDEYYGYWPDGDINDIDNIDNSNNNK